MNCYLFDAPTYIFYAPDIPELLYYSHFPTAIIALLIGTYVLTKNPKSLLSRLLFAISITFTGWILLSLFAWTNINGDFIAFLWPFFAVTAALLSVLSIYFTYVFVKGKDVGLLHKVVFLSLLAPVLLFAHTDLSISGFNLTNCDAFDFEGLAFKVYYTALGFLAMLWISILLFKNYKIADPAEKKQYILMGIGIEFFLFTFIFITFIVTYLTGLGYFEDSRLELYGLFGMTVFMIMMGILIVRFRAFNISTHASQALVIALLILVSSQFTFAETITSNILTAVTLVLTGWAGLIIVRSVKKEIEQREEIEHLAQSLERANKRLKVLDKMKSEFVSIASHQLRSPLTSIRGYASMLIEGTYGKLPAKAQEAVERIADSSQYMATSVEDYLNVSRIQAGNMRYECSDFNVRDEAEKVTDDLRREAMRKGLLLTFKSDLDFKGVVNADLGKTRQILNNLINNSIKYTEKGSIEVKVRDSKKPKRVYVDITDTGIGMSPETIDDMFEKFERAENANNVNVTGTGLGLFIARKIAREMKGDVYATSEGEGEGSTFTLELPLKM